MRQLLIHTATITHQSADSGTDAYNQPVMTETTTENVPCRLIHLGLKAPAIKIGNDMRILDYAIHFDSDVTLYHGDTAEVDGDTFEILFIKQGNDRTMQRFQRAYCNRVEVH